MCSDIFVLWIFSPRSSPIKSSSIIGAFSFIASTTLVTESNTSYSTKIFLAASSATCLSIAAIAATGCPLYITLLFAISFSEAHLKFTLPSPRSTILFSAFGISSCVITARTPSIFFASLVLIEMILA